MVSLYNNDALLRVHTLKALPSIIDCVGNLNRYKPHTFFLAQESRTTSFESQATGRRDSSEAFSPYADCAFELRVIEYWAFAVMVSWISVAFVLHASVFTLCTSFNIVSAKRGNTQAAVANKRWTGAEEEIGRVTKRVPSRLLTKAANGQGGWSRSRCSRRGISF